MQTYIWFFTSKKNICLRLPIPLITGHRGWLRFHNQHNHLNNPSQAQIWDTFPYYLIYSHSQHLFVWHYYLWYSSSSQVYMQQAFLHSLGFLTLCYSYSHFHNIIMWNVGVSDLFTPQSFICWKSVKTYLFYIILFTTMAINHLYLNLRKNVTIVLFTSYPYEPLYIRLLVQMHFHKYWAYLPLHNNERLPSFITVPHSIGFEG